jgi:hypothetical protein
VLPTQRHLETGLRHNTGRGDNRDRLGSCRQVQQQRFMHGEARNRAMLNAQCRAMRIGAAGCFQLLRQIGARP